MVLSAFVLTMQLGGAAIVPARMTPAAQAADAPITLATAVSQSRSRSARRRAAASLADGAREAVRYTGRLANPIVDLRTENWRASGRTPSPELDIFAVVTQPFELGGKRAIRWQLASLERDVAQIALTATERDLALETVRAYVRALRARALVETLNANRDGIAALITSVAMRVDEGYTAEADLLKFRTEAARVDGDVARAQLELDRSLAALGIVMGAVDSIQASQLVEPVPLALPVTAPDAIAAAVTRHPAVRSATARVDLSRQLTAFERARRVPDAAITAGFKRTAGFDTAVFGVTFAVPIFDHNSAAIARSSGVERAAVAERDAVVHQLSTEAASVIRAARTMASRAERATTDLLAPAEEVRRAARAAFREGSADVLKLIDAERVYAEVNRAAIDLRLDALLATIEARFAAGEETIP